MRSQTGLPTWRRDAAAIGTDLLTDLPGHVRAADRANTRRWVALVVFSTFSLLSFLDRQLLAAVAPTLKAEFGLSNADYGAIISAFSLAYMLMTPIAGWFVDRVGLNLGAMIAVGVWSIAGAATGAAANFGNVLLCRIGLGVGESGGLPSSAKAAALYLPPSEMALGAAVQQIGLFSGGILAPLLVASIASRFGWRAVFVLAGAAGFVWIPLWWFTSRRIPPHPRTETRREPVAIAAVLRDRRMWAVILCSMTIMTVYSLWLNWTTILFVQQFGLTQTEANRYFAWIPPVFATLGGFFGGWLALRGLHGGQDAVRVRTRICWTIAPAGLATALVPWAGSPLLAAGAISVSFFVCMALVTNLHVIPIDLFGVERAAFTSSVLTCAFALLQTMTAPAIGALVDRFGFGALCVGLSVLPFVGLTIATAALRERTA